MPRALVLLFALASVLAGCVQSAPEAQVAELPGPLPLDLPTFEPTRLLDEMRAGGEPVIAITPKGTILVAAHPGYTHTRYPPGPNLVLPTTGQSYLWRSTDGGETFQAVGLPMAPDGMGPRGLGQGVSDPDFAVDAEGRVYLTDLEGLVAASVSWSDDDGATWLLGNDVASTYGPMDRQWLATHGTDVYFMANYFLAERVLKSEDRGLTWKEAGRANCAGDLLVHPDGAILVGCATGIDVSEDGGATFEERSVPGAHSNARAMTEPAVDAAGNVYTAWADSDGVWAAGSPDLGKTWWPSVKLAANGTNVWPWIVAGDEGRIAVVWYHADDPAGPERARGDWFVDAGYVLDAHTSAPRVAHARVTPEPIFQGGICQQGTACQLDTTPDGDRRLGDFFEAAADAEGRLHVAFSVALEDSISHPGYARQLSGPLLRATGG